MSKEIIFFVKSWGSLRGRYSLRGSFVRILERILLKILARILANILARILRIFLRGSLRIFLRGSLWIFLRGTLRIFLPGSLQGYLWRSLRGSLWRSLRRSLWRSLQGFLWISLRYDPCEDSCEDHRWLNNCITSCQKKWPWNKLQQTNCLSQFCSIIRCSTGIIPIESISTA